MLFQRNALYPYKHKENVRVCMCVCYHAVGLYVRSLQCNGDAVQEDEKEDDMIKHLVTYDPLTPQPEPKERETKRALTETFLFFT